MGYILPITQYEYSNYQKRMIETKQNFYHVDQAHKVILGTKRDQNMPYDQHANHHRRDKDFKKLYTELTGKGKHFNLDI